MAMFDGVVIGGGHNGLTCAAYMARAGLQVAVVERNGALGGGCSTAEVTLPGFRHNLHSNYHYFEEGPVPRDLELSRYGLRYVYPDVQHAMVFRDGTAVTIHRDPERTAASFARFSRPDAESYRELHEKFAVKARDFVNQVLYSRPLTPAQMADRVTGPIGREMLGYGRLSLYEAVDQHFEDERVRCIFKFFLHAIALENLPNLGGFFPRLLSRLTRLGLPIGGADAVPRALGRVVEEHGGRLITGKHVERIVVKGGRAAGVQLEGGEVIEARRFVASGVDAPQTIRMAGEEHFGEPVVSALRGFRWAGHSLVTLHLALSEPPDYAAARFDPDVNRAFLMVMGGDCGEDLEANLAQVRRGELPDQFLGNGCTNTLFDPSLAPPGKHTSFWWPFAPYELRGGGAEAWEERREEVTRRILAEWREFAPNLDERRVLGAYLFTPRDIERSCINMVRGSHHVGAYLPTQLGASRPTPELSQYRTPVEGLYLCGSSSHSGGSVSGSPGYNCASTLAEDLELKRWWTPVPPPSWAE